MPRALPLLALLGVLAAPGPARAEGRGDGLYGRWDSDFTLAAGVGAGARWDATGDAEATVVGELRLRIVDAAGPIVAVEWGPDAGRRLVAGIELRPVFPALFLMNLSTGRERLDLWLASLGVELGAGFFLDGTAHAGLVVGLGTEVPLVPPSVWAQGLWLRLGARRALAPTAYRNGPEDADRSGWTVYATLAIKGGVSLGASRWSPPTYRAR